MRQAGGEEDGEVPRQAKQEKEGGGGGSGGVREYDSNLISLDVWRRRRWRRVGRGGGRWGAWGGVNHQRLINQSN